MKDATPLSKNFAAASSAMQKLLVMDFPVIVGVEAVKLVTRNFANQGFT